MYSPSSSPLTAQSQSYPHTFPCSIPSIWKAPFPFSAMQRPSNITSYGKSFLIFSGTINHLPIQKMSIFLRNFCVFPSVTTHHIMLVCGLWICLCTCMFNSGCFLFFTFGFFNSAQHTVWIISLKETAAHSRCMLLWSAQHPYYRWTILWDSGITVHHNDSFVHWPSGQQ